MNEIWLLLIISVILAGLERQGYFDRLDKTKLIRYMTPVFFILVLLLGGYIGLRDWCNDTGTYRDEYELFTTTFPEFWETFDPSLAADPGFRLCNAALKTMGVSTQNFLMIYSLVTIALYLLFLRKYSQNYPISVFLFFAMGQYLFCAAGIKQAIAVAIAFNAIPFLKNKKYIRFILIILLSSTFHMYTMIFLALPFLQFKPWSGKTYAVLIITGLISMNFGVVVRMIISVTSAAGESYQLEEFTQEGVNIFRVLVCNVPLFLSFIYQKNLFSDSTEEENLIMNVSMMNGIIMFVGLFGTANYFARLANFFLPAQAVALPWMLKKINENDRKFLTLMMILCYLLYFYYSCDVVTGSFERYFHRFTIGEYLVEIQK